VTPAPAIEALRGLASGALFITAPCYRRATRAVAPPQTKDSGLAIRCCAMRGAATPARSPRKTSTPATMSDVPITPEQVKAARGLLGWTRMRLALEDCFDLRIGRAMVATARPRSRSRRRRVHCRERRGARRSIWQRADQPLLQARAQHFVCFRNKSSPRQVTSPTASGLNPNRRRYHAYIAL
jgi:hypothetical protein